MSYAIEKSMVTPMVQQIMVNHHNPELWRKELIRAQIFDAQEAKDLTDREVSLIHHALLVQRFTQMDADQLLIEAEKYNVQYHVNLEENTTVQAGAICY